MRIAYVSLHWPRTQTSSIGKKIQNQTYQWKKLSHNVQFFSHLHQIAPDEQLIDGNLFFYTNNQSFLKNEISRINGAKALLKGIRTFRPDLIYLRWSMYVHPLKHISKIAPIIVEVNTNDFEEHKLLGFAYDKYNQATRSILLGIADGHIFTSHELANDSAFRKFKRPYSVVTNGINLENTPFYKAPKNTIPRLVFVGTPGMAWHGIDKLIIFARNYPEIDIDVLGIDSIKTNQPLPKNITFHGYKVSEEYEELLSQADAAIGPLSLNFIKGMLEASPLKIRDYAARGIPCILPYKDTDLYDLNCDEILNVPNTCNNIKTHGEAIANFVYKMKGKRLSRSLIQNRIDIAQKEKERVTFFENILNESRK